MAHARARIRSLRGPLLAVTTALALAVALAPARVRAQDSSPAARAALAHQLYDASLARLAAGAGSVGDVYAWSIRWRDADREAHVANAAQAHLERMTQLAATVHAAVSAGTQTAAADLECRFYVAEARAALAGAAH
jgi:hypothetical protein